MMVSQTLSQSIQACNVLHHLLPNNLSKGHTYEWESQEVLPFNEVLISWNAQRPRQGSEYNIYTSVKLTDWTPWLKYATWSSDSQRTYSVETEDKCVKVFQDTLDVRKPHHGTRIRIKIETSDGSSLEGLKSFHLSLTNMHLLSSTPIPENLPALKLNATGISQMALAHPRHKHLCSPTSTTALIRSLDPEARVNAVRFAEEVWDKGHDIYGNWVFNTSQAYVELKERFWIWVQRLNGFEDIVRSLELGIPVVVSLKGPLRGSPLHYESGHLMLIYGINAVESKVCCMDPAYPRDEETFAEYLISDFLEAWNRRGRVAYIASKV